MLHLRWLPHSWCLTLNLIDLYIGKLRRRFKMKERFTSLGTRIVLWNKDNISTVTFKNYFSSDSIVTEWFDYLVHSITKSCFWLKLLSNMIMMPVFNSTTCWGIPDRVWLWRNSGQHLLDLWEWWNLHYSKFTSHWEVCAVVFLFATDKYDQ